MPGRDGFQKKSTRRAIDFDVVENFILVRHPRTYGRPGGEILVELATPTPRVWDYPRRKRQRPSTLFLDRQSSDSHPPGNQKTWLEGRCLGLSQVKAEIQFGFELKFKFENEIKMKLGLAI
jgi:hypothetical protein